jgi:uncharacterized protein YciI
MAEHAPTVERYTQRQFLVVTRDGPDSAPLRDQHLEGHLEHIEKHLARYVVCGPILKDGGPELQGSFFVVFGDDEQDARALLDGDPYLQCGMYASVEVNEVTTAGGSAMGGVIWESVAAVRARQNASG